MMVIMHYALFISHYAGFGTHSKLSNFWVASDSLWVEPLSPSMPVIPPGHPGEGSQITTVELLGFEDHLEKHIFFSFLLIIQSWSHRSRRDTEPLLSARFAGSVGS